MLSILSAHQKVLASPNELNMFNSNPSRIDRIYTQILKRRIPKEADRWCEKTPRSVRFIAEIDDHFKGRFKYIHMIRDGRDVVVSRHPIAPESYWVEPSRWIQDVKSGLNFYDHPSVLTVKYEDLITDFEATISTVCEFLNLNVTSRIINWHKYAKVRENEAYFGEVRQISSSSIGKWKMVNNARRVEKLMMLDGAPQLLQRLGYLDRKCVHESGLRQFKY